jgi:predicted GIY-YIG superfamily endonuclease
VSSYQKASNTIVDVTFHTYVYLIQSIPHPHRKYIGHTSNVKRRLKVHNEGGSPHTSKFKPWKLVTYVGFSVESKALDFEKYLRQSLCEQEILGSLTPAETNGPGDLLSFKSRLD